PGQASLGVPIEVILRWEPARGPQTRDPVCRTPVSRLSRLRRSAGMTTLLMLALAAPAAAQSSDPAWDKIVAAANAEGALVMDSQPNKAARDFILAEWAKAYPKIALSLSVIPAPQMVARVRTERAAGRYLWDLSVSGANTAYTLAKEGAIDELRAELHHAD